jgi:hypothetical protein
MSAKPDKKRFIEVLRSFEKDAKDYAKVPKNRFLFPGSSEFHKGQAEAYGHAILLAKAYDVADMKPKRKVKSVWVMRKKPKSVGKRKSNVARKRKVKGKRKR